MPPLCGSVGFLHPLADGLAVWRIAPHDTTPRLTQSVLLWGDKPLTLCVLLHRTRIHCEVKLCVQLIEEVLRSLPHIRLRGKHEVGIHSVPPASRYSIGTSSPALVFHISAASFMVFAPMPTKCVTPFSSLHLEQSALAPPFHSHAFAGAPQNGQGSSCVSRNPSHPSSYSST